MANSYQDEITALKYLNFLNSANGQIQQRVLTKALFGQLPNDKDLYILEAGCGSGWLAAELKKLFLNVKACDSSEFFIKFAKTNHVGLDFQKCDLNSALPYASNFFDAVILNMVGPDLSNLEKAFKNIARVLKQNGHLLLTIPNPKYSYPAAVWKRSLWGLLFRQKPKLVLKNTLYDNGPVKREFGKKNFITSYHYNLSDYLTKAQASGFKLVKNIIIPAEHDSKEFDLNYQLYRYPLLLLLDLQKVV